MVRTSKCNGMPPNFLVAEILVTPLTALNAYPTEAGAKVTSQKPIFLYNNNKNEKEGI